MNALRQAALIARRDFRLIVWRREGIAWIFVMPLVFFYFIGAATGGLAGSGEGEPDQLTLSAPANAGFLIDELVLRLTQQNFSVVRSDGVGGAAARRLRVLPSPDAASAPTGSLTDWALAGNPIRLDYASDVEGLDSSFDRLRIARAAFTVLADAVVIDAAGGELDRAAFAALAAEPRSITLDVRPAGRRETPPSGFSQTVPGTMVMFVMLLALTAGAIHLVIERRQGLLRRLASAPVSLSSIVLGKLAGRALVAFLQIGFAMAVGTWLFGVDWGPSLPMVFVVLGAWALFNAALALLFGNLVRTEGQASGIGVMITMALAALGGAWWPIEIAPGWMQTLALFIPTGWAMEAMHNLVNFAYGPASVLPELLMLLAATVVLAWAGARSFRYS
jgi:hypothetical protein